jgi:hypothetical protein
MSKDKVKFFLKLFRKLKKRVNSRRKKTLINEIKIANIVEKWGIT